MMPREVIISKLLDAQNRLDSNPLNSVANAEFNVWSEVLEKFDEGAATVAWPFPTGEKP